VLESERLTPGRVRIVLGGPGPETFAAGTFSDHYIKLRLPDPAEQQNRNREKSDQSVAFRSIALSMVGTPAKTGTSPEVERLDGPGSREQRHGRTAAHRGRHVLSTRCRPRQRRRWLRIADALAAPELPRTSRAGAQPVGLPDDHQGHLLDVERRAPRSR
jgi:hypothetical protein